MRILKTIGGGRGSDQRNLANIKTDHYKLFSFSLYIILLLKYPLLGKLYIIYNIIE